MTEPVSYIPFHDVPIVAMFARYIEHVDTPVALTFQTATGAVLVMPFTGRQSYTEQLGGRNLIAPVDDIKPAAPEISITDVQPGSISIFGYAQAGSEVAVTFGDVEPVKVQADEWGRWEASFPIDTAGEKDIVVEQTDSKNRTSDPSEPVKIVLDERVTRPKPSEPSPPPRGEKL